MPTMDSIQIGIRDAGRPIVLLLYSSERVAKIKTLAGPCGISRNNTGPCRK